LTKIDELPLLKSICIKFIYLFRNIIPDDCILGVVDRMADYLKSQKMNQSYAAATIEKMLLLKSINGS